MDRVMVLFKGLVGKDLTDEAWEILQNRWKKNKKDILLNRLKTNKTELLFNPEFRADEDFTTMVIQFGVSMFADISMNTSDFFMIQLPNWIAVPEITIEFDPKTGNERALVQLS